MADFDYQGNITLYGIELNSRYGILSELKEMIMFAELAHGLDLAKYIKGVFYDSKCCTAFLEFHCGEVTYSDPLFDAVLFCANRSLSQFELGGISYNTMPLPEVENIQEFSSIKSSGILQ
jgi:hypothetical protein